MRKADKAPLPAPEIALDQRAFSAPPATFAQVVMAAGNVITAPNVYADADTCHADTNANDNGDAVTCRVDINANGGAPQ